MIIDTHCHILPGVDDGAKNADETRRMLRMAFKDGIDEIIATPHGRVCVGKKDGSLSAYL